MRTLKQIAWFALIVSLTTPALPQQLRYDDLANLRFQQDYPTEETAFFTDLKKLAEPVALIERTRI